MSSSALLREQDTDSQEAFFILTFFACRPVHGALETICTTSMLMTDKSAWEVSPAGPAFFFCRTHGHHENRESALEQRGPAAAHQVRFSLAALSLSLSLSLSFFPFGLRPVTDYLREAFSACCCSFGTHMLCM